MEEPQAPRIEEKIKIGYHDNEYRGKEELLINPPIEMTDYYNWLSNDKDPAVLKYLNEENEYFNNIMDGTKYTQYKLQFEYNFRCIINEKIKLIKFYPSSELIYFIYNKNLYRIESSDVKKNDVYIDKKILFEKNISLLLDVNEISKDKKFCNVKSIFPNYNETILSYAIDTIGNENYDIKFKDIQNNKILEIKLLHNYIRNFVWSPIENAIFYIIYKTNEPRQLWYFNIDTKKSKLLFEEKNIKNSVVMRISDDKTYLFVTSITRNTTKCYYYKFVNKKKINRSNNIRIFTKNKLGLKYNITNYKNHFIILTNRDSKEKNFKLMCVSKNNTNIKYWFDLINNDENINIRCLFCIKDYLILLIHKNGLGNVGIINLKEKIKKNKKKEIKYLKFPGLIYDLDINYHRDDKKFIIEYSSYNIPKIYYEYDLEEDTMEVIYEEKINDFNPKFYETKLINVTSDNNVNIPLSIVYNKKFGKLEDKPRPFLLSAYGAYGYINDYHILDKISLLNRSIVFAQAHVRGGGEFGEMWHENGKKNNKINSIIDFIACSEYLIENNYTKPELLAICGSSAGGLLVYSSMILRPELYKVVISRVPFIDPINTLCNPKIPGTVIDWDEYGNPNIKKDLMIMKQYAPYNNIQNVDYPHTLIMAGFHDNRVPYWEAAKFMAKLRHMKTDNNIHLLHMDMNAGHYLSNIKYDGVYCDIIMYSFLLKIFNL